MSLIAATVNYTLVADAVPRRARPATALAYQGGCFGVGGGGGPQFCNAFPVDDNANRFNIGLGELPFIFPEASVIDHALLRLRPAQQERIADVGRHAACCCRRASPGAAGSATTARTTRRPTSASRARTSPRATDISISLTKVWGRHTMKTGFYNQYSNKQQVQGGAAGGPALNFQQDTVGTNPCDTSFGFANAAIGCFSSYAQGSKGVEGKYIYYNVEGYVQDNWKVNSQTDARLRRASRAPDAAVRRARPGVELLHRQVDAVGGAGALRRRLRQRRLSVHRHEPSGDESADRTVPRPEQHARNRHASCPNSGNPTNGLVQAGKGIPLIDLPAAGARRRRRGSAWPTT